MADGRLIIDTGVDNAGAEQGLKKTEKLADQSVSKIESSLKDISKIKASPKIIADTASADANLARLKAQTKSIEDKKVAATIDASTGNFDSKYSRIKLNLENFTKEKVSPNISANTVDADAKLARMRAQFTALGKVKVKPSVNADTTDATAKTSKIKSLLQSISDKAHKVTVWAETSSAEKGLISIKEKSKLATIGIKEIVGALGLVQIASSAINAIAQSMDGAISRFDIMKKYPKVMESLGINAEDSTKSIKKLSDGIDGLPTTLDDVVSSAQRITSITGNIEKSTDATIALNNAFLASGSSTEDASRGMQQYIQMLSRGKVDMESWQTLQETMPVALQKVAESFGLVGESAQTDLYDKLKEGEITFAEFQDKLIELGTGTGMLAELARVNSEGIATSFQNLKTAVVKGLEGILQKVNDTLRSLTGKNIADYINGFKTQLNAFFDTVGNLAASSIPYILNFLKTLEKIAPIAASVLSGIIAYKSAMTIVSIIGKVASAFSFFANVLGSIGSISGLFAGITAVIGPIGWIALAIGAVTSALVYFWNTNEDFRNFVISAWDNIKNAIVGAWESIQPALATGWEIIKSTVSGGVSVIQDSWGGACALMKGDFDGFKDHIENSAKTIRETGKKIFDSLPESAQDNVRKASDKLKEIGKDFIAKTQPSFDKIKAVFGKIIDTVKPVFEQISRLMTEKIIPALKGTSDQAEATGMGMSEGMKPAFSVLNDLIIPAIEIFANVLAWAVNFITPILMAIGNLVAVVSNVVGFITAIFNGDWAAAWGFAGGIVDGFKNIVVNVLDFILQIFGTSCADITTKLSGAVSTIQGILTTLSTIFSNVFSLIHGIVTGNQEQTKQAMLNIWNALPSPIQGVLTNITNIISGKLNEALAFVRGLKDKMLSAGRDMMNGLADGIKDAINAPIDWIRQAADNIKSAFDAKFDINSPSKWGFGRGAFVMQGVVNGLKSIDLTGYFNSVIDRIKDKFTSGTLNISTLIKALGSQAGNLMAQWGIIQSGGGLTGSGWSFPTDSRVVTDEFGYRESPGGIGSTYHQGLDIGAGMGEPIYAAAGGNVTMAGYYGGYGNAVIIDHGNGIETLYGHMSEVAIREGAVAQGQVIGYVGSTGNSTGPHLHFSVMVNGEMVDPRLFLGSFKVGTPYIPRDGYAYLHEGEAVLTKEQNRLFNGKSMVAVMENAVRAEMIRVAGRISAQVNVTVDRPTGDGNGDFTQHVYFKETPKKPSEMRAALRQEGRRLAFVK